MAAEDNIPQSVPLRLQKFLARAGVASRRGSENLMTAGRVTVNGRVVTELGTRIDPATDVIAVDGVTVEVDSAPRYVILNKPAGYITTMDDPRGRPTVASLIDRQPAGLFPVGRLDMDTTGVLLFTTDGELGNRLMHPRYHVEKVYEALVDGVPDSTALRRLESGVSLDDGLTKPARVRVIEERDGSALVELVISEGRKHQVKRMLEAVGHPVSALHRTAFGPVLLGELEPGRTRTLGELEISALKRAAGLPMDGAE